MASILATATEYANQNFSNADCSDVTATPNINNPCVCLTEVGGTVIGSTGRVFLRVSRNEGEICNDTDFVEITNAILQDGSRVADLIKVSASTATKAQINLANGVAKTSPADGDIWRVNGAIYIRLSGTTYTFDLTSV